MPHSLLIPSLIVARGWERRGRTGSLGALARWFRPKPYGSITATAHYRHGSRTGQRSQYNRAGDSQCGEEDRRISAGAGGVGGPEELLGEGKFQEALLGSG